MKKAIIHKLTVLCGYYLDEIQKFQEYGDHDGVRRYKGMLTKLEKLIERFKNENA